MSTHLLVPGNSSVDAVEQIKKMEGVDANRVARLIRDIVQFEWSDDEEALHRQIEKLFVDGALLMEVTSMTTFPPK